MDNIESNVPVIFQLTPDRALKMREVNPNTFLILILPPNVEELIVNNISKNASGSFLTIDPDTTNNLLKIIGILDLLIFVPGLYLIEGVLSMDGGNPSKPSVYCLILGITIIVIGILINKYTKKLCKNNINKN